MYKLPASFYLRNTLDVAKDLIGCFLVRKTSTGLIIGRINETEAYIGAIDKACHAYQDKRTPRTEPLFHEGGIAYIYLIYGMYYCLNFVTEEKNIPAAILIRGCEIVEGIDIASTKRYGKSTSDLTHAQLKNISNGPGKLCIAFGIDKSLNFENLSGESLFVCSHIYTHSKQICAIQESKRIGIEYAEEAKDFLWRFTG